MTINTEFLTRCILTLESAFAQLQQHEADSTAYDVFSATCVK